MPPWGRLGLQAKQVGRAGVGGRSGLLVLSSSPSCCQGSPRPESNQKPGIEYKDGSEMWPQNFAGSGAEFPAGLARQSITSTNTDKGKQVGGWRRGH